METEYPEKGTTHDSKANIDQLDAKSQSAETYKIPEKNKTETDDHQKQGNTGHAPRKTKKEKAHEDLKETESEKPTQQASTAT